MHDVLHLTTVMPTPPSKKKGPPPPSTRVHINNLPVSQRDHRVPLPESLARPRARPRHGPLLCTTRLTSVRLLCPANVSRGYGDLLRGRCPLCELKLQSLPRL